MVLVGDKNNKKTEAIQINAKYGIWITNPYIQYIRITNPNGRTFFFPISSPPTGFYNSRHPRQKDDLHTSCHQTQCPKAGTCQKFSTCLFFIFHFPKIIFLSFFRIRFAAAGWRLLRAKF